MQFRFRQQTVGRADPVVPLAQQLTQQIVILAHIFRRFLGRQFIQFLMIIGVVPYLMPLGGHPNHDIRVFHQLTAHHKESRTDAPFLQSVQQAGRTSG